MKIIGLIFAFFISGSVFAQKLVCDNQRVVDAWRLAVNTVDINIRRGILAAGGDYGGEWTRDIAINSWNGVSLLRPRVAENSLWSVTINKDSIGHQYWDKIIWVLAAYNHYKVTGNRNFLRKAYRCSVNSMNNLEQTVFDRQYGLFTGPSVFNDGIAGYPEPAYDPANHSSFVLDYKNARMMKCLSTNCLYYGAYQALAAMGKILNEKEITIGTYREKALKLRENILKYFYSEKESKFYYLIDKEGKADKSQEGLGVSFAILFGVIDRTEASKIIRQIHVSKFGIPSIYPDFPRFSPEKPGRHNNIIWPMVNGFFAQASIMAGERISFARELDGLTSLALDEDKGNYNFREIYNPYTGVPDGGWQCDYHWNSCKYQTWSATAYISMVLYGLVGMHVEDNSIVFSPYLPDNVYFLEIDHLKYRQADLKVILKGQGSRIKSFLLNGKEQLRYRINSTINGRNVVTVELCCDPQDKSERQIRSSY